MSPDKQVEWGMTAKRVPYSRFSSTWQLPYSTPSSFQILASCIFDSIALTNLLLTIFMVYFFRTFTHCINMTIVSENQYTKHKHPVFKLDLRQRWHPPERISSWHT
ncbi:hypothetical protein ABVK25_010872 [Lepraria finkii]|uniref:Uncharacterized protein n=1 Tax=Lepraria finkii TaxID=1340010 RepID=A0ABR4ATF9_9LECA